MMVGEEVKDANKLPSTFSDKMLPSTSDGKCYLSFQYFFYPRLHYTVIFASEAFT